MNRASVGERQYLLEMPLWADYALVHAFVSDYLGNLAYVLTARNFNPVMGVARDCGLFGIIGEKPRRPHGLGQTYGR